MFGIRVGSRQWNLMQRNIRRKENRAAHGRIKATHKLLWQKFDRVSKTKNGVLYVDYKAMLIPA